MKPVFKVICQAEEKYREISEQGNKENKIILKKFEFFKEKIKVDITYGEIIKKSVLDKNQRLINNFFQKYGYNELLPLDNCFCCDLTRTEWRMLYTISRDIDSTVYVLCFMIVDHKTYEKYFT